MVGKIIREYMAAGNKKLTVPGFGTFMRKDTGEVIFVDLLRKDDGKLRELVEDYGHYSEVEAMALVDRFIFETKNGIEKNGSAPVAGFGTMFLDNKGLYQFNYAPQAKPAKENPVQEQLFSEEPRPAAQKSQETPRTMHAPAIPAARPPSGRPEPAGAAVRPAPGQPEQRGFSDNRRPHDPAGNRGPRNSPKGAAPQVRKKNKPSKPDKLILIAIIAAVIAILVMVFGLSTGNMPFLK